MHRFQQGQAKRLIQGRNKQQVQSSYVAGRGQTKSSKGEPASEPNAFGVGTQTSFIDLSRAPKYDAMECFHLGGEAGADVEEIEGPLARKKVRRETDQSRIMRDSKVLEEARPSRDAVDFLSDIHGVRNQFASIMARQVIPACIRDANRMIGERYDTTLQKGHRVQRTMMVDERNAEHFRGWPPRLESLDIIAVDDGCPWSIRAESCNPARQPANVIDE
jgi:hypothetical protein